MEEENLKLKKSNNRKKMLIVILIFVIVLMGLLLFIFFTDKKDEPKKEENKQQEKQEEKKEENKEESEKEETQGETPNDSTKKPVSAGVYKTKDGKFTLKIADFNDSDARAKAKSKLHDYDEESQYAFINDLALRIFMSEEDDKYLMIEGWLEGHEDAQYGYRFLVSKEDGLIHELRNPQDPSDVGRFTGEDNAISFVKTKAGYFFTKGFPYGPYADSLYTTSWKEIGYVEVEKIESDEQGVYVYTKIDEELEIDKTSKAKFDINGNKIG